MSENGQSTRTTLSRTEKRCRIEGCKRPYRAKGYCNVHYTKWRKGELPRPRRKDKKKEKKEE